MAIKPFLVSLFAFSLSAATTAATTAHAAFPIKNGQMIINIAGDTGENGGSVDIHLTYANPEKTIVKITGSGRYNGKAFSVNEQVGLDKLKQLAIYASGGDGYNGSSGYSGSSGSNGWDGNNGWDGSDGCPPGNGSDGSDGSDGRDGTDGGDGSDGGNGGNGGSVRVSASAAESELLLLLKASAEAGSGGYGGSGGSGGSGGRGGTGGRGGRGGRNTCKNDKGEEIGGPSGWDGRNGQDGRNGRDGNPGRDGSHGYDGKRGSVAYVVDGTSYARPFKLDISAVKAVDDNEDSVVSPGETVHLTEITIANSGPMPTPASQALSLAFASNSTLTVKAAAAQNVGDVIPGNGTRTLTFPKGTLVFQAPDKTDLIGKKALLSTKIQINSFSIDSSDATGLEIKWPVGIATTTDKASLYFGSEGKLNYVLTNVSTKEAGPSGPTPIEVEFKWDSKTIPAKDVYLALADGRQFTLEAPYTVKDFTVPAKGKLAVPVTVKLANSKGALTASGNLKVTLKLKDFSSDGQDAVDSSTSALYVVKDFRGVAFNKTHNTKANRIVCRFPKRLNKTLDIVEVAVAKNANSNEVRLRIAREGFLSNGTSPVVVTSAMTFAPYGGILTSANSTVLVNFLNKVFAPLTARLESTWQMQAGACAIKAN